jgi:hypothetical protein
MFTLSEINISQKNSESIQINPILKKITMYDGIVNTRTYKAQKLSRKTSTGLQSIFLDEWFLLIKW